MRSKRSILLIDDEVEILNVLTLNFEFCGYECFVAGSTAAGEDILKSRNIDLVICDVIMPTEGGLEFLERLNKSSTLNLPPFLFCSGVSDVPFSEPYPSGVIGFMFKPFPIPDLLGKVESIFSHFSPL